MGEFTRIITNIKSFKKIGGKCYLGVVLIIDKHNWSHINDFVKLMNDIGVNSVKLSPCIVSNKDYENNNYHDEIFNKVRDEIERTKADIIDTEMEIFDSYHCLDEKFVKSYEWCPYCQILPVIGADQNLYACHDKAYNLDSGLLSSLKDKRLQDVWFEKKELFFKINPSIDCQHHCVVNSINEMIFNYTDVDRDHLAFV